MVSATTNTIVTTIPVGKSPFGVSVSPDGSQAYVVNSGSNNVSVINTATNAVTTQVPVGVNPLSQGNLVTAGAACTGETIIFKVTIKPFTRAPSTIIFPPFPDKSTCNIDFPPNATSNNPMPIQYTSSNLSVATISADGIIHIVGPGTTTITAMQDGNDLFAKADPKSQTLTVTQTLVSFISSDVSITQGNNIQLTPTITGNIASYSWTPATGLSDPTIANPVASPNSTTTYNLHVTATSGCEATGSITVNVKSVPISIPNTFTPNGDGKNDTWNIKYLDTYTNCTVKIFTRYGQNVFSSIGYGVAWDGSYNGSILPTGTYYYIIDLKDGTGQMAGWVAIIK